MSIKFKDNDIKDIIKSYQLNESSIQIAKKYNVSSPTIINRLRK